jgi:hypothetical protein
MSALITFFNEPWTQAIFWALAAVLSVKFISMPELMGGGTYWRKIALGVFLYGLRVSFKLMPFYGNDAVWPQVVRYSIGIIAAVFLTIGFAEYYYSNLKNMIRIKEEAG